MAGYGRKLRQEALYSWFQARGPVFPHQETRIRPNPEALQQAEADAHSSRIESALSSMFALHCPGLQVHDCKTILAFIGLRLM